MKKTVFTLLIFMVCTIQAMAYEYFTIYFSDGTKSEAFYATDVDSICYSKLSLDGIAFDEWQVQEIYTCDSVYRYPLAQIDSLSFKDVDENKVAEDIANAVESVSPLFASNLSSEIIEKQINLMKDIDGIDDVYCENQVIYVKIRDWGYISFNNSLSDEDKDDDIDLSVLLTQRARSSVKSTYEEHQHINALKACIMNQQYKDEKRMSFHEITNQLSGVFNYIGIDSKIINSPSLDFFKDEMFNYDILFIKTHGTYEEKENIHWICTGEELWSYNPKKDDISQLRKFIKTTIPVWINHGISPKKIGTMCVSEVRGGETVHVYYTAISDKYIASSNKHFVNDGAIVFNSACESLMKNNNMARAFIGKGAGCYLGYDASNSVGGLAGKNFFAHLSVGKSVYSAYSSLPEWCKKQTIFVDDEDKVYFDAPPTGKNIIKKYKPQLKTYPSGSSLCITHPRTGDTEESLTEGKNQFASKDM